MMRTGWVRPLRNAFRCLAKQSSAKNGLNYFGASQEHLLLSEPSRGPFWALWRLFDVFGVREVGQKRTLGPIFGSERLRTAREPRHRSVKVSCYGATEWPSSRARVCERAILGVFLEGVTWALKTHGRNYSPGFRYRAW